MRTAEERFWAKVDKRGPDECWEWKAARHEYGYGTFCFNGTTQYRAHRFSFELAKGPIPDGMLVCHRCDNRPCVNPAHLFLGTPADNVRDMVAKGRSAHGERKRNAKLTSEQVIAIRTAAGTASSRELSRRFGVSAWTVLAVIRGEKWRHVSIRALDEIRGRR